MVHRVVEQMLIIFEEKPIQKVVCFHFLTFYPESTLLFFVYSMHYHILTLESLQKQSVTFIIIVMFFNALKSLLIKFPLRWCHRFNIFFSKANAFWSSSPFAQVANPDHRLLEKAVSPEGLELGPYCPPHWASPPAAFPGWAHPRSNQVLKLSRSLAGSALASDNQTQRVLEGWDQESGRTLGEPGHRTIGKIQIVFVVVCYCERNRWNARGTTENYDLNN